MRSRTAAVVGLTAMIVGACAMSTRPAAPVVMESGVRFELSASGAAEVAVAGDFNGWSTSADRLVRDTRGLWTLVVPLPPGEHVFMYVVDGEWISPPLAEDYVDDGFGSKNGIVVVR